MKKILLLVIVLSINIALLASCAPHTDSVSESTSTEPVEEISRLDKLYQIEKGWTVEEVESFLGKPDRYGELSSQVQLFYTIDTTTEAEIIFWGEMTVVEIRLNNTENGKIITVLRNSYLK
ncbi:MAG: hypothetical protein IJN07_00250 [Clostridia bacterium]|nr:hypothetical protein [Clostridia bacterium]